MTHRLLFDPKRKPMRVACFMSGSGTNVRKIIEHQMRLKEETGMPPFKVVLISTDNPESNAEIIAKETSIPLVVNDIKKFYGNRDIRDKSTREEYDQKTLGMIKPFKIDVIALGGYAWFITKPLLSRYLIINVHPADLSVTENGKRKYVGLHDAPPRKAILAGEKFLHSSTHIVREKVDYGEVLLISKSVKVELPYGITIEDLKKPENEKLLKRIAKEHQNKLKEFGDWEIFPLTLQWIAEGRFGIDENRNVYFDDKIIPKGYRL